LQMREQIIALAAQWQVDLVIVEGILPPVRAKLGLGPPCHLHVDGARPPEPVTVDCRIPLRRQRPDNAQEGHGFDVRENPVRKFRAFANKTESRVTSAFVWSQ
jgi:hypothetical protein